MSLQKHMEKVSPPANIDIDTAHNWAEHSY